MPIAIRRTAGGNAMIAIVEYLSLARMRKLLEHDDAATFGRVPVLTAFRPRRVPFESVLRPPSSAREPTRSLNNSYQFHFPIIACQNKHVPDRCNMAHAARLGALTDDLITAITQSTTRVCLCVSSIQSSNIDSV